jgi:hypothetical protein
MIGNAIHGTCQWLLGNSHMMAIRMEQDLTITHDADMAFPEDQIAALQIWQTI